MIDQLRIGEKSSFDDYWASMSKRKIGQPAKKSIKETVPFSNITYDFSAINGELYWEERELEYEFEIIASTPEELEEAKTAFSSWVMNVMGENLYDPFDHEHHFIATFENMSFADDEGLDKTTATVKFKAYPFKVANVPKVYDVVMSAGEKKSLTIVNKSSHRITPTLITDGEITLKIDADSYAISAGEYTDENLKIPIGLTTLELENLSGESCTVTLSFCEEVF